MTRHRIARIVVHCTDHDPRDGRPFVTVPQIRGYHMASPPAGRGWRDIGYHYVIARTGRIWLGRPEDGDEWMTEEEAGAHALGYNRDSVAVAVMGGFRGAYDFAPPQIDALASLCQELLTRLDLPPTSVVGHGELDPRKTCPVLDMCALRRRLVAERRDVVECRDDDG